MIHILYVSLLTCFISYMFHFLHVSFFTCSNSYMFHFLHVSFLTCFISYLFHFLLVSFLTWFIHCMIQILHDKLFTCFCMCIWVYWWYSYIDIYIGWVVLLCKWNQVSHRVIPCILFHDRYHYNQLAKTNLMVMFLYSYYTVLKISVFCKLWW